MPKQKRPASSAIMTDKVTELILHDTQTSSLAPGAWLKQTYLEQRYRCGRLQARRALDWLAQKRLVAHVPNRGYDVYRPDGRHACQLNALLLCVMREMNKAIKRY